MGADDGRGAGRPGRTGRTGRTGGAGGVRELELAERVMDAALMVTRLVRREVRRRQPAGLSVSQVRALSLLSRSAGVSLAELAEYVGLGAPAASRLVEELVRRRLVAGAAAVGDRRRLALRLLPAGAEALGLALEAARAPLAERLVGLAAAERGELERAMGLLVAVLSGPGISREAGVVAAKGSAGSRRSGRGARAAAALEGSARA